jgi:predicted XRE-type DNA-binding protein
VTSFDFDISEQELAGAQHITAMGRRLIAAFLHKMRTEKLTKAKIAERLGVDKAYISRLLRGDANMTLRTEGELYWAMGYEPCLRNDQTGVRAVLHNTPHQLTAVNAGAYTSTRVSKPKIAVAVQ